MKGPLLRGRARLGPNAGEVEVGPLGGEQFAAPCAGQQQQPHGIGGALVAKLGQLLGEPTQLGAGQVAVPLALLVALDTLARVIAAPTPTHRQREHLREARQRAVGMVGARALILR